MSSASSFCTVLLTATCAGTRATRWKVLLHLGSFRVRARDGVRVRGRVSVRVRDRVRVRVGVGVAGRVLHPLQA
jgi:hypothetical protein